MVGRFCGEARHKREVKDEAEGGGREGGGDGNGRREEVEANRGGVLEDIRRLGAEDDAAGNDLLQSTLSQVLFLLQ
jgi:hypothetical protein